MAKRILTSQPLHGIDIQLEGAIIASEVVDASEPLNELCSRCGTALEDKDAVKICNGKCKPKRTFHKRCLPEVKRNIINFQCQLCNPSLREEYCQKCSRKPQANDTVALCMNKSSTGCCRFVHKSCIEPGRNQYRCGVCTVNVLCKYLSKVIHIFFINKMFDVITL